VGEKRIFAKFINPAMNVNEAWLYTVYTVPSGKKFLVKEILLDVYHLNATYIDGVALYILKNGGVDFSTGAVNRASVRERAGAEATPPDVVIEAELNAIGKVVLARNTVLEEGDAIKIIVDADSANAPRNGDAKGCVLISGDEF